MHSPLWTYLGVEPSGIAVTTRNNHTSECQGALHKVLSEGLKLTHTLRCLPQVGKVTIASFCVHSYFIFINSVVYIQTCIHTSCFKCYLTHNWHCPKHICYMHVLYTKLHIACLYCINSEQLLLVMFVKVLFSYCIIYLVCMPCVL